MTIRTKLPLAFLGVALIIAAVGYIFTLVGQKELEKSITRQTVTQARQIRERIDNILYTRIQTLQAYAIDLAEKPGLHFSNRLFSSMQDRESFITRRDQEWKSSGKKHISPFISNLIHNELSKELRIELELKEFYREKTGHEVFSEIFVTNRYGVIAAQTKITSDYYQGDEIWWQESKKNGLYVSDVEYDDSADVYSTSIAVRVDGGEGEFLGILKAVVNIEDIFCYLRKEKEKQGVECKLITRNSRIIYSTEPYVFLEPLSLSYPEGKSFSSMAKDLSCEDHYFISKGDRLNENNELYVFAHSRGYETFPGLRWILIVEHDRNTLLEPVKALQKKSIIVMIITTTLAITWGIIFSRSISNPLRKVTKTALRIGEGELGTRVDVQTKDEVGQLARAFNAMSANLLASRETVESEILDRVQAEHLANTALANIDTLLDTVPVGVIIVGKDKRIRRINQAALTMIGNPPRKNICGEICHQHVCPSLVDACPVWDCGQIVNNTEQSLIHSDGHQIPILKTVTHIMLDGEDMLLEVFIDITERKRIENDMAQSKENAERAKMEVEEMNKRLEKSVIRANLMAQEIQATHAELAGLNEELEARVATRTEEVRQLLRQKDGFVNRLGHDLKTPLMPLVGLLPMVEQRIGDSKAKNMIRLAIDSVGYMRNLVERTLCLARFNVKEDVQLQEVHLWTEVRNAVASMLHTFEDHHMRVDNNVDMSLNVFADPIELWEVLQNLLSNAVQYTNPGGVITIKTTKQKNEVIVSISDTGIGMSSEEIERIFEEFYKADKSRHDRSSIGLGLSICKQIVSRQGGRIWAQSAGLGQGSTIYFTLRVVEEEHSRDAAEMRERNSRDSIARTIEAPLYGEK